MICIRTNLLTIRFALMVLIPLTAVADAAESIKQADIAFACQGLHPDTEMYFNSVYKETFSKIGYNFKTVQAKLDRALIEIEKGTIDGLCGRILQLNELEDAKNLLRINIAVFTVQLNLWTTEKKRVGNALDRIKQNNSVVGYSNGSLISELFIEKHNLHVVVDTLSVFHALEMLKINRIQYLLSGQDVVSELLQTEPCLKLTKTMSLAPVQLYPYLHKRWSHLIPEFEKILKDVLRKQSPPFIRNLNISPTQQSSVPSSCNGTEEKH